MRLGDLSQAGEFADARVGHQDVQVAFFFLDRAEDAVEILRLRHIRLDGPGVGSQCLSRVVEDVLAPSGNEDEGAFFDKALGRGQADAAGSACDQCDFTV